MVSKDLSGLEMDLLVLWKVFIEVMNTLDHNSPDIVVAMVSPEFWIGNWIGPFEVEERVITMKENKNVIICRTQPASGQEGLPVFLCEMQEYPRL